MVRGRGASPPMEGKGPREGQQIVTGQYSQLVADEGGVGWKKIRAWKKFSRGVGVPDLACEKKTVAVFS